MSFFSVKDVTKSFFGNTAVDHVSIEVEQGEIVGLIGANGAGKTTFFNCLTGYYKADSGEITFRGTPIGRLPAYRICRLGIARTFQIAKPFGDLTVRENVMIGAFPKHKSREEAERIASEKMEFTGLADKAETCARDLNTGDQRRLELARALATEPEFLLLDEVMAGLTPAESAEMVGLIQKIRASGVTILMIEHIMTALMTLSDRVYVLDRGRLIAEGTPEEVVSDPLVIKSYLKGGKETQDAGN